ncbi:hypothetical protein AQUCO_01400755v1 [Aquilegia coerulea]|uniref:Uncharacterized protein n=1 Tax=Aquilegia coerulea TaxID=218851 RepID=A0A2G5DXY1_AQUCA|nr:hypothetical protein AQUCO_01400755v1 [Aquilegia coerulea]
MQVLISVTEVLFQISHQLNLRIANARQENRILVNQNDRLKQILDSTGVGVGDGDGGGDGDAVAEINGEIRAKFLGIKRRCTSLILQLTYVYEQNNALSVMNLSIEEILKYRDNTEPVGFTPRFGFHHPNQQATPYYPISHQQTPPLQLGILANQVLSEHLWYCFNLISTTTTNCIDREI